MKVERRQLLEQEHYFAAKLAKTIFIHPTDTHYGIGCDATNTNLVLRLRLLKKWQNHPFVVIAPNKKWVLDHLDVPETALDHLPGATTIIARIKKHDAVCRDVHLGTNILGVRMPNHWISSIIARIGKPIVSTCANRQAQDLMTSLDNADPELLEASEYIIYEGAKEGRPSVWVDYTGENPFIQQ